MDGEQEQPVLKPGQQRWLSSEEARRMTLKGWANYPTAESRRIRTLRMRIATGKAAERELNAVLGEAAQQKADGAP